MNLTIFKNNHEAFIGKHIHAALQSEGYDAPDINRGIQEAIRFYRTTCTFTKGRVFDSCLAKAKQLLKPSKKIKTKSKSA